MSGFFEDPKEQSEIKAEIVEKYFGAWSTIMKSKAEKLGYIDLFSGPGRYKDGTESTPIKILKKIISDEELSKKMVTIFNDSKPEYIEALQKEIKQLDGIERLKYGPNINNNDIGIEFANEFKDMRMIPCISFIDPWGYKGLTYALIESLIKDWGCDCIFFFNYNRVNMGLSNPLVEEHINAIFGDKRAEDLRQEVSDLNPHDREDKIINELAERLSKHGEYLVLPFQFYKANKKGTSHYIIFVTKNKVAYKIMKEIMAKCSSEFEDGVASFSYTPVKNPQLEILFNYSKKIDELEEDLLDTFSGECLTVKQIFYDHNIGTPFILKNYKEALLNLEKQGKIQCEPPAQDRRNYRGKKSMADKVKITFP